MSESIYEFLLQPGETKRVDLYKNEKTGEFMGFVELVDVMPRIVPRGRTGDIAMVQGARVSYGSHELKSEKADKGLVEYLVEHYHTSPLEMGEVKFICNAPLFIFNQLVRHRTASVNCISRRYTEIPEESFYVPELRVQSEVNHQGSDSSSNINDNVKDSYQKLFEHSSGTYQLYKQCCDSGVGKEVARGAMPQNIMTSFVWKMDLHNFLKMCRLRTHSTAQKEIQDLANAMYQLVKPMFPIACGAYEKFWLNAMSLSEEESDIIKKGKNEKGEYGTFASKRRQSMFEEKLKKLGLIDN